MRRNKRSCHNCQHSRIIRGKSSVVDCLHPEVDFKLLDKHKNNPAILPQVCGHYRPVLIENCLHCNQPINQPAWSWNLWVEDVFEDLPVCCYRCQKQLQKELDRRTDNFSFNPESYEDYPF